ncbi:MAG TPA: three-Cys-motif partner protein TcmP [bacterium]|nr:three-Cys-motif partner protein TcmP [bacterium]
MNHVTFTYGNRADQIHDFFKAKREWSKVKDEILGKYIACYLKTIQHRGRPIIIIDAFAGPGNFGDGSDGSPLITCKTIEKVFKREAGIGCIFSDSHPAHRTALEACLCEFIDKGIAEKPLSDFAETLSRALEVGKDSTLFFYLDPYGIKDLDFDTVRQIYERDSSQSTEVLINFNFRTFMRMSGNWNYNDSASEVSNKVKDSKTETVNRVMGGDYWRAIVTNPSLDKIQREDAVVGAYMDKVRAFFNYTFSIPVKELDDGSNIPADDLAKYHLIFGTRSPRAVVYMNDVANIALEPYFNQFTQGLLFPMTPERYEQKSLEEVKSAIIGAVSQQPMKRPQIYEAVIPMFFLQYRSKDYRAMIESLVFKEKRLFANPQTLKLKNKLNDQTFISTRPWN